MALFSDRLPHVLTAADLSLALAPTYARETGVAEELAVERLAQALKSPQILDHIYQAVSKELRGVQRSRSEDAVIDVLSKAVPKWRERMKAVPASPAVAAVTVRLNIELGLASTDMQATLESDRGRVFLEQGFGAVAAMLVKKLVR